MNTEKASLDYDKSKINSTSADGNRDVKQPVNEPNLLLKSRICENCQYWHTDNMRLAGECNNKDYLDHYNIEVCKVGCFASCGWFKRSDDVKEQIAKLKN